MGLGNFLRDTLGGAAAGFLTGGPGGAVVGGLAGATQSTAQAVTGGGGGRVSRRLPQVTGRPVRTPGLQAQRDSTGVSIQGPSFSVPGIGSAQLPSIDFSRVTGQQFTPQTTGQRADALQAGAGSGPMQQFQQGLMMSMLQKKVRSKSGRAILEAMMSGSINEGLITEPDVLTDSYGRTRHQSPPGYRTVEVNNQKVSVFKPLAMALNLLPKTTTCKVSSADMRKVRRFGKNGTIPKRLKKLAKDAGFKVTNK